MSVINFTVVCEENTAPIKKGNVLLTLLMMSFYERSIVQIQEPVHVWLLLSCCSLCMLSDTWSVFLCITTLIFFYGGKSVYNKLWKKKSDISESGPAFFGTTQIKVVYAGTSIAKVLLCVNI